MPCATLNKCLFSKVIIGAVYTILEVLCEDLQKSRGGPGLLGEVQWSPRVKKCWRLRGCNVSSTG